jgi:hypothetical protein
VARVFLLVRTQILYRINRPNFTSANANPDFPDISEARHRNCLRVATPLLLACRASRRSDRVSALPAVAD